MAENIDLWSLVITVFALYGTPGSAVLAIIHCSLTNGFRHVVLMICGIQAAIFGLYIAFVFGLGTLFVHWPVAYIVLKWSGAVYLYWLARSIYTAGEEAAFTKRMGLRTGMLLVLLNPKVYLSHTAVLTAFVPLGDGYISRALIVATMASALVFIVDMAWGFLADKLSCFIDTREKKRRFYKTLAVLLCISVTWMLWPDIIILLTRFFF